MPGSDIIREAIKASWTIETVGGVLAVSIVIIMILLVGSQSQTNNKLIQGFHDTNKQLLESNREIAHENHRHMANLTEAVNNLASETRKDITVLQEKVDGLEDTIRDRQMMP